MRAPDRGENKYKGPEAGKCLVYAASTLELSFPELRLAGSPQLQMYVYMWSPSCGLDSGFPLHCHSALRRR